MAEPIIDFVQTWVDGSDPAWQQRRRAIDGAGDDSVARYRDWNLLHYWFRCVEKFAPWVRHVYLITDQQCPAWLNREHPKLRLLDHRDYIPAEYLPTCNSNVLELNLHRIPDLAEQFVLFNDDFFLLRPAKPEDFFQNGLPVDDAIRLANAAGALSTTGMGAQAAMPSLYEACALVEDPASAMRRVTVEDVMGKFAEKYE